ncbi:MAG: hypothetical protein R6W89_01250 [Candidatus Hydrogenedentota bacterium]
MNDAWNHRDLDQLIDDALSAKPAQAPPGGFAQRVRIRVEIQAALDQQRRRLVTRALAAVGSVAGAGLLGAALAAWMQTPIASVSHHMPGLLGQFDAITGNIALSAPALTALVTVFFAAPLLLAVLLWPARAASRHQI